ncbi:hypothetical protein FCIRC_8186 [Fusarium circinatum]|uniref:Uncharacterized protein n=1 Tax=Fusarium circinatum TaxID=48490 RepID=A0A8H5WWK3_FUSCI|nr:hypothetical protein FCIRC_8186 [Fusarium circinatum]
MEYKLLKTEVHELQGGSPGHDNEAILAKLMSLEVTDVQGEMEYCPRVGNRTMEAAQQHILKWAAAARVAVHARQRMREKFDDGVDSN